MTVFVGVPAVAGKMQKSDNYCRALSKLDFQLAKLANGLNASGGALNSN